MEQKSMSLINLARVVVWSGLPVVFLTTSGCDDTGAPSEQTAIKTTRAAITSATPPTRASDPLRFRVQDEQIPTVTPVYPTPARDVPPLTSVRRRTRNKVVVKEPDTLSGFVPPVRREVIEKQDRYLAEWARQAELLKALPAVAQEARRDALKRDIMGELP
jgi:hypothetical protein